MAMMSASLPRWRVAEISGGDAGYVSAVTEFVQSGLVAPPDCWRSLRHTDFFRSDKH
jgi:hypothetical protein